MDADGNVHDCRSGVSLQRAARRQLHSRVNDKVMKDPRMKMPFDVKRILCGGFKLIVDA
jgi:uncharacterized protein YbaA (DUF1428 family)